MDCRIPESGGEELKTANVWRPGVVGRMRPRTTAQLTQTVLEYVGVVFWMLFMTSVVHTMFSPRMAEDDMRHLDNAVNLPVASFNLMADLVLVLLILPHTSQVFRLFLSLRPLALFCFLVIASTFWSTNPSFTLRRATYFVITAIAACYFGHRYSVRDLGRILVSSITCLILFSLLTYLIDPAIVIDVSHPGQWMGIAEHKNVFGQFIALSLCFLLLVDLGAWHTFRVPLIVLSVVMLFLTHSTASWLVGGAVILLMPLLFVVQRAKSSKGPLAFIVAMLALAIYAFTNSWTTSLLQLLGKDPTLTGRTELWESLLGAIARRPLLGYGYEAFFSNTSELLTLQSHSTWLPPSAHNGYLQVAIGTGLVGFILALWFIVSYLAAAISFAQTIGTRSSLVPLAAGIFWILHNGVEVTLLVGQTLIPFIIFAFFASIRESHDTKVVVTSGQWLSADYNLGRTEGRRSTSVVT